MMGDNFLLSITLYYLPLTPALCVLLIPDLYVLFVLHTTGFLPCLLFLALASEICKLLTLGLCNLGVTYSWPHALLLIWGLFVAYT